MNDELYFDYLDVVRIHYHDLISNKLANVSDIFKGKLKEVGNLLREVIKSAPRSANKWIEILKDKKIFKFFQKIGFSLKKFYDLVKTGFDIAQKKLLDPIAEYAAKNKVTKWTRSELQKLDKWLQKHPTASKITGVALCALLIYINLSMTYVGEPGFDFDMGTAYDALMGKFSIADIFTSPSGIKMLMLLATGVLGVSFPWPSVAKLVSITGSFLLNYRNAHKQKQFDSLVSIRCMIPSSLRSDFNNIVEYFSYG